MRIKHNYKKLLKEFFNLPFGDAEFSNLSKEGQIYVTERYILGLAALPSELKSGDKGYNRLLGFWSYTKTSGIKSHINLNKIWVATIQKDLILEKLI